MDSLTGRHGWTRGVLGVAIGLLALSGGLASGLERSSQAVADAHYSGGEIYFQARVRASAWTLTVTGPGDFVLQTRTQGSPPSVSLYDEDGQPLPDGSYGYELQAEFTRSTSSLETQEEGPDGRSVALREGVVPYSVPALAGHFRIAGGSIVTPAQNEPTSAAAARPVRGRATPDQAVVAAPDQVINDDQIVTGSLCVGFDCVNGESFGFDTMRLKENNIRIKAQDTSNSASFPSVDWQITFNDSSNGGENKFSIDDIDSGRTPFTIEHSAPSHSLYVDDGGRIGLGTKTPVVELHVKDGDTPTLRLEQDGSSGFTPQTWDVAGNETNFFVRDVTNGSKLPFKVFPSAPTNALTIEGTTGDIGIGTTSPEAQLHVRDSGVVLGLVESSDSNAVQIRMKSDSTNRRFLALNGSGVVESQIIFGDDGQFTFAGQTDSSNTVMTIDASGNVVITGNCSDAPGGGGCTADHVFGDGYELMPLDELADFVAENKHLPNVPPADETRQKGLNLSAMNGRLLEKIEELTLYTLAQQEIIERLEERLSALEQTPTDQ